MTTDQREQDEAVCRWSEDFLTGAWHTQCKHFFVVEDGKPSDNSMRFCCYCGKPLKEVGNG